MIRMQQLSKSYRTTTVETTALDRLDLTVETGELVAIMGPSGCGKSTLLNVLGLIDGPTAGQYHFLGEDVSRYSERQRSRLRRAHVGFIFQSFNLIDDLTVFDNVELPLKYLKVAGSERRRRVQEALESVGLEGRMDHFPQQLSGGQQQRVAIARAVVIEPELILADEPTGNLDSARGREILDLLQGLHRRGTTIVFVTHSASDAALAQRIVRLHDGRLVDTPAAELPA